MYYFNKLLSLHVMVFSSIQKFRNAPPPSETSITRSWDIIKGKLQCTLYMYVYIYMYFDLSGRVTKDGTRPLTSLSLSILRFLIPNSLLMSISHSITLEVGPVLQ